MSKPTFAPDSILSPKVVDGFRISIADKIFEEISQIEGKLHILRAQQQVISLRASTLHSSLNNDSWLRIRKTFGMLIIYQRKLQFMKFKMTKTLNLVRGFSVRQANLIKNHHNILSLKQWKEGELNSRLQADEAKIEIKNLKIRAQRPVSLEDSESSAEPILSADHSASTGASVALQDTSSYSLPRSSSSVMTQGSKPRARGAKGTRKKKGEIDPLFASLLGSLPRPAENHDN